MNREQDSRPDWMIADEDRASAFRVSAEVRRLEALLEKWKARAHAAEDTIKTRRRTTVKGKR